ncbi:MAG TPA: hypothetical protein VFF53_13485 [Geobacteraceae bacterium]|nr:hypothetical protein [Geobacteraceae bacterium]
MSLAVDLGTPVLSEPLQQEKFFDTERLTIKGEAKPVPGALEPHLGLSHDAREDVGSAGSVGVSQTTHKIHGEAGGKLNLLDNVSVTAIAKIPLYTYEARFGELSSSSEGKGTADLMRNPGNLSWRSEMGVSLGSGVDLNLFYDRSTFGRVDKPGVNELDEKVGTRFIIHFK